MDVFCEYCGSKLDVEKDAFCPKCGAPFDDNPDVKRYHEQKLRQQEHDRHIEELKMRQKQQEEYNRQAKENAKAQPVQPPLTIEEKREREKAQNRVKKIVGWTIAIIFLGPTVLSLVCGLLATVIDAFGDSMHDYTAVSKSYTSRASVTTSAVSKAETKAEQVVKVNFNETAQTNNYSFICDEVFRTDIMYGGAEDGYMYVVFHFKVKNTSKEKQWLNEELNCIYDGDIICDRSWGYDGKRFNTAVSLSAGLASDGYICYIVPENAKRVTVLYGDYVNVNIDLTKLEDRRESTETSSDNN